MARYFIEYHNEKYPVEAPSMKEAMQIYATCNNLRIQAGGMQCGESTGFCCVMENGFLHELKCSTKIPSKLTPNIFRFP